MIRASALLWGADVAQEIGDVLQDDQPTRVLALPSFIKIEALPLTANGESLPLSAPPAFLAVARMEREKSVPRSPMNSTLLALSLPSRPSN